jgi:excisionase family DNA binding protein
MGSGFSFDAMIEAVATAVAEKLRSQAAFASGAIPVQPRLLSVEQAAIYLGRTKPAIQHMIADGTLRAVRADRRVFLDKNDLDQWIDRNKV